MAKGSKYQYEWYKKGLKLSKKVMKKYWNRQARRQKLTLPDGNVYKKLKGESAYCMMP